MRPSAHGLLTSTTEKVAVITADGRTLVGNLCSADNQTNLVSPPTVPALPSPVSTDPSRQVLQGCIERVIREPEDGEPSVEVPLGLYIVRGDNVCVVGLVDEALDASIDWTAVKGAPIGGIKHS